MTKIKTLTVDGTAVVIHVDDKGQFHAHLDGANVKTETLTAIETKLRTMIRRRGKLAVPVTELRTENRKGNTPALVDCELTGIHAGNDNVLIRDAGKKGTDRQMDRWGTKLLRRLTESEKIWLQGLYADLVNAQLKVDEAIDGLSVNPRKLIADARAAQGDTADE